MTQTGENKMVIDNTLQLIGNTPMIKVQNIDTGVCDLFLKLECQNPGGSIKDRIAVSMIEAAEKDGKLKPGDTILEATAGNTGIGLSLVAAQKGYKMIIVLPDKMSQEKIFNLKAMGAEVVITRSDVEKGHPEYYQEVAQKIAGETGAFYINQFGNEANPLAHEMTTGPEIWEQLNHDVDAVVCGVGSGGTLAGLSRFFKKVSAKTEMVLADPVGSVLVDYVNTGKFGDLGSWIVEGIGEDFIPPVADFSSVKKAYSISDQESCETARHLLKSEGLLGGSSSGTLLAAALRYCREQNSKKRVVTFVCDTGNKYLSKVFNDYWIFEQGLSRRNLLGDLRDIISRSPDDRAVIMLGLQDTLSTALARMKMHSISQLPVMGEETIVGIVDELSILNFIQSGEKGFETEVAQVMNNNFSKVPLDTDVSELTHIFKQNKIVLVYDGAKFYGLITPVDILSYLKNN